MARSKFNIRQLDILSSSAAMNDGYQGTVSDDDLFIFQNRTESGAQMKVVDAQTLQSYFSEIDLTSVSSGEYTLVFADIDNDQDGVTDGYALKYDSQDTEALSWSPSTNLMKISGSLNMADDGVLIRFGADQDVTLTHVADTGLQLNGASELQFRDSALSIGSSADGQLDIEADSVMKVTAPTAELEASTEILLDSPKVHMEDDSARLVFGADEDARIAHDGSDGLDVVSAGGFDLDAGGAISLSGSLTGEIQLAQGLDVDASTVDIDAALGLSLGGGAASDLTTTSGMLTLDGASGVRIAGNSSEIDITTSGLVDINSGNFDLDAAAIELSGSSYGSWEAAGNITLDSAASININADSNVDMDGTSVDIEATSGAVNMDASAAIVIGGSTATTVDIGRSGQETDILGTLSVDEAAVFDDDVTITGNLTVNGATTTLDTVNLLVEDPFVVMAKNVSGSPSMDQGFMFERGSSDNTAIIWDESADEFALIRTTSSHEVQGNVEILDYYDLHLGALTVDDSATIAVNLTVEGLTQLNGSVDLGDADTDTVTFNADVDSDVLPSVDVSHDLGASGAHWSQIWVKDLHSSDYLDLNATEVRVDAGTLNVSSSVANFRNLDAFENTDLDQPGADSIMVRDNSAATAKHMSFAELGQYLSRGTSASAPGTGIQVNESTGVLSIDVVEAYRVSSDFTGAAFSIDDNYATAILADSFELFLNGQLQIMDGKKSGYSDYSVSGTTVTMEEAIDANDVVIVRYIKK